MNNGEDNQEIESVVEILFLERQERITAYQECACDFALDEVEQQVAEEWLGIPLL